MRSRASRVLFMGLGVEAKVDVIGDARREAPVSSITRSRHSWLVPLSMTRRLLGKAAEAEGAQKTTTANGLHGGYKYNAKTASFTVMGLAVWTRKTQGARVDFKSFFSLNRILGSLDP